MPFVNCAKLSSVFVIFYSLFNLFSTESNGGDQPQQQDHISNMKFVFRHKLRYEETQAGRKLPWLQTRSDNTLDRTNDAVYRNNFANMDREKEGRIKRSLSNADGKNHDDWSIPAKYIVVVKPGIPSTRFNQTSLAQLRMAFATVLHLPTNHVKIYKIWYNGRNDIEMFFLKDGDDLIPAHQLLHPEVVDAIKKLAPLLNITGINTQDAAVLSFPDRQPYWMGQHPYFPYLMAAVACGVILLLLTTSLIYCCCKKKEKTLKETDDEIRASQKIFYPTVKPDLKNPLMIQPDNSAHFIAAGCVTPVPAQPVRLIKAKGLLERRGSNASLTIDLNPSPEMQRWDGGTPPKESTGLEYLLSAGNRLSRRDLRNAIKHPQVLHEEFWEIPMNIPEKVYVAGSGMKNRYKTIIPNEHSRVVLPDSEWDPLSSYINANYIRGYDGEPHTYVATQGPLPHTIVDFWRMVWNEKSPIIVMITKLREKGQQKCENYLPETYCSCTYGDVEVKVEKTVNRNGYIIHNIVLKCGGECHYVLHYWYTAWPDHKPPDTPTTLLDLVKEVDVRRHSENQVSPGPVIVHCSAGIGRTGCFTAISVGMRQLREESSVDILGIVCSMRVDRGGMIQTHEQYSFIHQALAQYEKELAAEPTTIFTAD